MRQPRYTTVAIILHWVIALGILLQIIMGLAMMHLAIPILLKFKLYQLHKSVGITVLFAVVLRLLWRLTHRPPALPADTAQWQRKLADGTHITLYVFMFALPLTGWALVSVSPYNIPTVLYGLIPWPDLPVFSSIANKTAADAIMSFIHTRLSFVLMALLSLHIAAALYHQFFRRDHLLRRMLPFGRVK